MNRTKHRLADARLADARLADARLADARLADARLADGVYWFHIIFILVLLLGILWPNPEWCTIMLTLLVMATILYFVFDGCALDKYEQYFRGNERQICQEGDQRHGHRSVQKRLVVRWGM
jgi:hypothetical protein